MRAVRQLCESAQAMGLLRKQRRQLLLTARAIVELLFLDPDADRQPDGGQDQ